MADGESTLELIGVWIAYSEVVQARGTFTGTGTGGGAGSSWGSASAFDEAPSAKSAGD